MQKFIDLTGRRFERLIALKRVLEAGDTRWECRCDCGNLCIVLRSSLTSGNTRSCGCLHKDVSTARIIKLSTTHGSRRTRLYNIWSGMRTRCTNPNHRDYNYYGARGIKVCPEWDDFTVFRDWALSHGYDNTLTIERGDNDKDYCPGNCAWILLEEQSKNKRAQKSKYTNGQRINMSALAKNAGISRATLYTRLARGIPLYKALTQKGEEK